MPPRLLSCALPLLCKSGEKLGQKKTFKKVTFLEKFENQTVF
jgi:hypothetical protein